MLTVSSFCELCPTLIRQTGPGTYILSEVFCQDPLERYFSQQRHRGGSNDNPTVQQFRQNSQILMQQQQVRCELKTMNVEPAHAECSQVLFQSLQSLPKRPRKN